MKYVPSGAPFAERGGRLRGVLDLVAGRYPPFLFGLGLGRLLPAFHFHETTVEALEPAFRYLAENGYRAIGTDELSAFVRRGAALPPRAVLLAFDDALASLWLVAAPLLRRYGLRAVTYAIPGRIVDAPAVRPTIDDGPVDAVAADSAAQPFATWPELRALVASGEVEVQSHTWSHSMIYCSDRPGSVVTPATAAEHVLNQPRLNVDDPPAFLDPARLGFPIYDRRSRMSDARRFLPDLEACARVEAFVRDRGGRAFFERPDWMGDLGPVLANIGGRWETPEERTRAIEHELVAARDALEARLGTRVRHVCLPWGVTGTLTQSLLPRLGFETAVANRLPGMYAIRSGDDPFFLKRLPHRHIFALPGRGRRAFRTFP